MKTIYTISHVMLVASYVAKYACKILCAIVITHHHRPINHLYFLAKFYSLLKSYLPKLYFDPIQYHDWLGKIIAQLHMSFW